jgi:hypothetical protein
MVTPLDGIDDLSIEVLELLYSKSVFDSLRPESEDARENMRTMKLIQVVYDDMVLRLWKFLDNSPTSNGGRPLIDRLRKRKLVDESRLVAGEATLIRLRAAMLNLEEYRHTRVAHIAAKRSAKIKPHSPLLPAIREAVALVDNLKGARNSYSVLTDDLRVIVLGEPPDPDI